MGSRPKLLAVGELVIQMNILLDYRFPQSDLTLKPGKVSGQSALCLVYADVRAYQDALDLTEVCWSSSLVAVNATTAIVSLTVNGCTRSASGEDTDFMSAEARAFKRACSSFGLGRYLYGIDLGFQPFDGKRFGQAAYAALDKALAALTPPAPMLPWQTWSGPQDAYSWAVDGGYANCDQHARNALNKIVTSDLGGRLTKTNWPQACELFYHNRIKRKAEKEVPAIKDNSDLEEILKEATFA